MKKIFSIAIIISILSLNSSFAIKESIYDDFVQNSLDSNLKIKKEKYTPLVDDFASNSLSSNLKIQKEKQEPIHDDLVKNLKNINFVYYDKNQKFDFSKATIQKAKIRVTKYHTTRKNLQEGQYIDFELIQDININNKTYKKGSLIKARVENISPNLAYGTPADIVIDNFVLANEVKLTGQIQEKGANRAIWVYPLAYTTSMFFGIGLLAYTIRGGHAKLKPTKIYEINID